MQILLWILNFDLFLGYDMQCDPLSWSLQWQRAHKGQQPALFEPLCTHMAVLFSIGNMVFNKLHEIVSMLLQNRLCVRWFLPKCMLYKCSEHVLGRLGVLNAFSVYIIFNLQRVYWDITTSLAKEELPQDGFAKFARRSSAYFLSHLV